MAVFPLLIHHSPARCLFNTPMKHSQAPCSLLSTVGKSWCSTKNTRAGQTWSCAKGRVSEMLSAFTHMVIKKIIIVAWCLMSHWSAEIKINSLLCLHNFILSYKNWNERRIRVQGFIHLDMCNETVPIPVIVSLRNGCQGSLEGQAVQPPLS